MGSQLIFRKKLNELVNTAVNPPKPNEAELILERILSGAAEEGIEVTLLLFQINNLEDMQFLYNKRLTRKLISGLIAVLLEQTPEGVYVDCIGYNEFLLIMPNVSLDRGREAGNEICRRFRGVADTVLQDKDVDVTLLGSVVNFPLDSSELSVLFGLMRCALFEAKHPDKKSELKVLQSHENELVTKVSSNQLIQLESLSKNQGVDMSQLVNEAITQLINGKS